MLQRQAVRSPGAMQDSLHVGSVTQTAGDAGVTLPPIGRRARAISVSDTALDGGDLDRSKTARTRAYTMGDRLSTGGADISDRLRAASDAARGATWLSADHPRARGVRPNLSGVRSLFVSDWHHNVDELVAPPRAQTPSTPWNPQPQGRQSANREQLGIRALRDLGILQQVKAGCDSINGPGSDDVREAYRLLTVVEPPRAALLSARVARAKPTLIHNPGAAHLLLLLEVSALYAAEDLKGAAAVLLKGLSVGGGYAGSLEVERLYERVVQKTRFHRQFFDKQAPALPDVEVRPPTPEPEPEPEVFLGSEWEGRLKRLRDLWSIEPNPAEALIALRCELRDRIALLSKVYIAYCAVDAHGQKIPHGKAFGTEDNRLGSKLQQSDDDNAPADKLQKVDNLLVVRLPSVVPVASEEEVADAVTKPEEATNSTAANEQEFRATMLFVGGLEGDVGDDEEVLSAVLSQFGTVLLVNIHRHPHNRHPNWALVSFLRPRDAEDATRSGKEALVKELEADGCEFDENILRVEYFDVRTALESTGAMSETLQAHHEQLVSIVQKYDGGIERLLQLQTASSGSSSRGSSAGSESEDDSVPDLDDGGGVGLTMEMCAYEKLYLDQGSPRMYQFQWWRLMKSCRLPSPELRNHEINVVFRKCQAEPPVGHYLNNLVPVGANEAVAKKEGMPLEEVWEAEMHHPHQSVNLYDYVELLVRVAHGRYPEVPSIALRLRIMLERDFGPRWPGALDSTAKDAMEKHHQSIYDLFYTTAIAQGQEQDEAKETADADMVAKAGGTAALAKVQSGSKGKKKQGALGDTKPDIDKALKLHWRSDVQEWIAERSVRMWKVFHFMAGTARDDLAPLLSFNLVLKNLIWCEMLSPELTVKRCAQAVSMATFDPDVAPQHHPSNDEVLLTYEEFEEALVRFAAIKAKGTVADDNFIEEAMVPFVEQLFTQIAYKMPGRF